MLDAVLVIAFNPCYTFFLQEKKPKKLCFVGSVQKIFFVLTHYDRLSSILINLIFSVLKNERGVRGEFHFSYFLFNLLLISYKNIDVAHATFKELAEPHIGIFTNLSHKSL